MDNAKKKYEAPDAKKHELAEEDIMKISKQNDDNGGSWGEFIPFIKLPSTNPPTVDGD